MRPWSTNPAPPELRPDGVPWRVEVSHGRVYRRADQSIKTLTLASEILLAALVLGPSSEDSSEFGPTNKGHRVGRLGGSFNAKTSLKNHWFL